MNYFLPPAQRETLRGHRRDPPRTWGSSREQTMPRVASKLSLSHSPTAWMQPRTWITSSSSRRWSRAERSVTVFIEILGFWGDVISCVRAFSQAGVAWEAVGNWFIGLELSLGFLAKKTSLGANGPYARRYRSSAATQPRGHPRKPQKSASVPPTSLKTQLRTRISWGWPRKDTSKPAGTTQTCHNTLRCQGKAIKMNLYPAGLEGEEFTCRYHNFRGVGEEAKSVCTKEKANVTSLLSVRYPHRVLMTPSGTCGQRIGE